MPRDSQVKECITHHYCDCVGERLDELSRRLKKACEGLRKAAYAIDSDDYASTFTKLADELEAPLEEK